MRSVFNRMVLVILPLSTCLLASPTQAQDMGTLVVRKTASASLIELLLGEWKMDAKSEQTTEDPAPIVEYASINKNRTIAIILEGDTMLGSWSVSTNGKVLQVKNLKAAGTGKRRRKRAITAYSWRVYRADGNSLVVWHGGNLRFYSRPKKPKPEEVSDTL